MNVEFVAATIDRKKLLDKQRVESVFNLLDYVTQREFKLFILLLFGLEWGWAVNNRGDCRIFPSRRETFKQQRMGQIDSRCR